MEGEKILRALRALKVGLFLQPLAALLDVVWVVAIADQLQDLRSWEDPTNFFAGLFIVGLLVVTSALLRARMFSAVIDALGLADMPAVRRRVAYASWLPALRYLLDVDLVARVLEATDLERLAKPLRIVGYSRLFALSVLVAGGIIEGLGAKETPFPVLLGLATLWLLVARGALLVTMASAFKQAAPMDVPPMRGSHDAPVGFRG
jgi:hypothetical protein